MRRRRIMRWVAFFTAAALLAVGTYGFAQSATVNVTVQPAYVGVSVSPSSIDYGVLPWSATSTAQAVTATNTGNWPANLTILGDDARDVDNHTWTLSASPGSEQYTHEFSTDGGANWTALTKQAQGLASNVGAGQSAPFQLRLKMPTGSASTKAHSTTVTVMASMP